MSAIPAPAQVPPREARGPGLDLPTSATGDRVIAWVGAVLAAGVSVAVNIGHAWPQGQGFVAFSATLPLLVLISAEQMARRLLGAWTLPVLLVVGVCAYSLSFWHAYLLLGSWGEPAPLCITGAIAVDGLAVGSVVALYRVGAGRITNGQAAPGSLLATPAPGAPEIPAASVKRPSAAPAVRPVERPGRIAGAAATTPPMAADLPSGGRPSTPGPAPAVEPRPAVQVASGQPSTPDAVDALLELADVASRVAANGRPSSRVDAIPRRRLAPVPDASSTPAGGGEVASTPEDLPDEPSEEDVWKLWDTRGKGDGRTYAWLARQLGVNEEAARGRARRRKG